MQVLKEEVRKRIRSAALHEFAASGAGQATMSAIAARAEVGAATLYSYYDSKEALLLDVIPPDFAEDFEKRLTARVRALSTLATQDPREIDPAQGAAHEIATFWFEHRLQIVVLLDRAAGTRYAEFGERFVEQLTQLTWATLRKAAPGLRANTQERLVLQLIFENTRRTLATLLERSRTEASFREALRAFWSYQLPGLNGFTRELLDSKQHREKQ